MSTTNCVVVTSRIVQPNVSLTPLAEWGVQTTFGVTFNVEPNDTVKLLIPVTPAPSDTDPPASGFDGEVVTTRSITSRMRASKSCSFAGSTTGSSGKASRSGPS